jgi:soluble lytic murein transglycosylase
MLLLIGAVVYVFTKRDELRGAFLDDGKYDTEIVRTARKYGVDSRLVKALIFRESRFNPNARGKAGEVGLMQIIPGSAVEDWARYNKVQTPAPGLLFSPSLNIEIGTWYLSRAMKTWRRYRHGTELALCQYNAGRSRAESWKPDTLDGAVLDRIKIKSTRAYVEVIMHKYRKYCKETENKKETRK